METKFISHEEALRIRQQNNQIQKKFDQIPLPSLINDQITNQLFKNPLLQLTNHAWKLNQSRLALAKQKRTPVKYTKDDELEP